MKEECCVWLKIIAWIIVTIISGGIIPIVYAVWSEGKEIH